MENSEQNSGSPSLLQHAIRFGVILGIVNVILVAVLYAIDLSWMVTFKFLLVVLVIGLGGVIYAGINYRGEAGGYLSYGKAFQHGFITFVVAGVIGTIFNIVLYHVIDPDLPQKLLEAVIANTEEMMRNFGAPDDQIDQAIDKMKVDMVDQFSVMGQVKGFGKMLIGYAIITLITSLFVRKNEPVEGM